ncbi:MAG: recombinase RecT [Candidatus Anammoxibacter sp.]
MEKKQLTVIDSVRNMEGEFKAALPSHIPSERFTRNAVTVLNSSPELLEGDVDKRSLFGSIMKAAQHGLIVDGREAALISFKNKKTGMRVVQYIPMVEGMMKLVRNSGDISVMSIQVVKENDSFDYELGDNEHMLHKPALTNRGKTIGAYSIVTFKDGGKSREWMDLDQINAIMNRKSYPNPIWKTDYDEMCRKTVFRRHFKRLPKSSDLDIDEVMSHDDNPDSDIQNISVNVDAPVVDETKAGKVVKAHKKKEEAVTPEPDQAIVVEEVIDVVPETEEDDFEPPM